MNYVYFAVTIFVLSYAQHVKNALDWDRRQVENKSLLTLLFLVVFCFGSALLGATNYLNAAKYAAAAVAGVVLAIVLRRSVTVQEHFGDLRQRAWRRIASKPGRMALSTAGNVSWRDGVDPVRMIGEPESRGGGL